MKGRTFAPDVTWSGKTFLFRRGIRFEKRRQGGRILPRFSRYTWSFLPDGMTLDDKSPRIGDPR